MDPNQEYADFIGKLMENVMKEHGPKCISSLNNIVVSVAPSVPEKPKEEAPVKEKKKRCGECHKKLGLIAFPCKCGGEYCALHRNNADHNCSFDFHADAKNALSTMLVKVEAKKLEVI